jgi:hypothetical protein
MKQPAMIFQIKKLGLVYIVFVLTKSRHYVTGSVPAPIPWSVCERDLALIAVKPIASQCQRATMIRLAARLMPVYYSR